jgi:SpoVK/Ycf46/Vps4 family AAA+-type ATPase
MMHALYKRGQSESDKRMTVPTLYVRSLSSFAGPEYSLRMIFLKARETAPCYLVFEDLDSIVNDSVRSYFLNEVDGLKSNDGILMVGSTNHLDRLDPGISKRPSRFDRKYYFPDPNFEQRVAYAKFWQDKLKDNEDLDFPDELCSAVAKITDKFSFAYMQEAFVASLLAIAVRGDKEDNSQASQYSGPEDPMTAATCRARFYCSLNKSEDSDAGLDKLVLWKEIQVQVKILKEEMDEKSGENSIPKELNSSKPYPECKMVMTETHGGHASSAPAEPKKESNYQSSESSTAEPSLFSSFEQWKETNSSRLSNPPIWSRPAPEPKWVQPKRMLESSIGMTPQYTARMVLDDVERVRGEMLRYQASRPAVVPSITADGIPSAFPHQVNTQSWPVARGGLPPPGSVSGAPNAPQYQPMDWTVQPEHRAYPDNLPPRSTIDQRETHTLMMGNPFSAPPLDTDQERKMWVQKDREDFEKKMEDIRAKIARIE